MGAVVEAGLRRFADRLRLADGTVLTVRFVEPRDAPALQNYVRSLSPQARSDRFLGGASELSRRELDDMLRIGAGDRFAVVAELDVEGAAVIVAEARYMCHASDGSVEFGLSVHDRWRRRGIGAALLANLECRAAVFDAGMMFGDTRRSNAAMQALARKAGFGAIRQPDDWTQIRFVKTIGLHGAWPCAGTTVFALARAATSR